MAVMSPEERAAIEATMAEWLAHPMEFSVRPARVNYVTSINTTVAGKPEPVDVHIVEYEMPDGTRGKGFVNPVTWSFLGPLPYEELTDVQLVTAYSGWLWLFSALNHGGAEKNFEPQTRDALIAELASEGISDISVTEQYKVGTSEFFEFRGVRGSAKIKGAGSAGSKLVFEETAPQASLPIVYTYLGMVMRGEI